jgi:alpha-L-rhamnosidase
VTLRHAETLRADGNLYLANMRGAAVTDVYRLKGGGPETYEPRFTYHGFRYVEVTGFPGKPTLESIVGRVVHDDLPIAGNFECSEAMINQFHSNVRWGLRGNYRSVPTDCPQRDERQAWLGDRTFSSRGESFLFDTAAFYSKWLQDMADAQKESGSIPDVCPSYWPLYNDNVAWPSAALVIPSSMLDHYADSALISRHYPAMTKWISHMSQFIENDLIAKDNYGDWCVPPEDAELIHSVDPLRKTNPILIATAYFCHNLNLMSRYAKLLGKSEDADRHASLSKRMAAALNLKFYDSKKGFYDNGSQTSCVLPLAFGLVPETERKKVFTHLVHQITTVTRGHIGTGLVGGQWLNRVLTDGGRADLVKNFATQTDYPSWGYMIKNGATTVWELWNGNTANPAMNSGNHVMLVGDSIIWLYESLAGIKADSNQPGFKRVIMSPEPVDGLTFVRASHRSLYGEIRSAWEQDGRKFKWVITIPPNTTASVRIPCSDRMSLTEAGQSLDKSPGVTFVSMQDNGAVIDLTAGSYTFESK